MSQPDFAITGGLLADIPHQTLDTSDAAQARGLESSGLSKTDMTQDPLSSRFTHESQLVWSNERTQINTGFSPSSMLFEEAGLLRSHMASTACGCSACPGWWIFWTRRWT